MKKSILLWIACALPAWCLAADPPVLQMSRTLLPPAGQGVLLPPVPAGDVALSLELSREIAMDTGMQVASAAVPRRREGGAGPAVMNGPPPRVVDVRQAADEVVRLVDRQRYREALIFAREHLSPGAPARGQAAAARAAREENLQEDAARYYARASAQDPANPEYKIGRIYALTDAGQGEAACQAGWALVRERAMLPAGWEALGYALRNAGHHAEALLAYTKLLALQPDSREGRKGRILALNKTGASHLAVVYLDKSPGLFSTDDERRIRYDSAVQRLHWERAETRLRELDFANTDPALGSMERLTDGTSWTHEPGYRGDRIVALVQRKLHADAIAEFEAWSAQPDAAIPLYVKQSITDAYQSTRQPEKALPLFDELVAAWPRDMQIALGRFYTLVDLERHDEAMAYIDHLVGETPAWAYDETPGMHRPNDDYHDLRVAQGLERAYADRLADAEPMLDVLRKDLAPASLAARSALATLYLWRGWPDAAEEEWELVRAYEPTHREARIGLSAVYAERGEWERAHAMMEGLQDEGYRSREMRENLARRAVHDLRELNVEAGWGLGGVGGGHDFFLDAKLYSRPLDERWRIFGHDRELWANTRNDGRVHKAWRGVGAEYTARDVKLEGELFTVSPGYSGPYLRLDGRRRLSDHWSVFGGYTGFDTDTASQALAHGIRLATLSGGVEWRHSELRTLTATVQAGRFSDHNRRLGLDLSWTELLHVDHRNRLYGTAHLGVGSNSRTNTPYYSPSRVSEAGLALTWEHLQFRRFEYEMWHRISVGLGRLNEAHFGASPMSNIEYAQRWRYDLRTAFEWGIAFSRRSYDGIPENRTALFARLNVRF